MKRNDTGNILIYAVVITALLVATGLGYMKWAGDEAWDTSYEQATIQSYFNAQAGIIELGLPYLKTRTAQDLPQGTTILGSGPRINDDNWYRGVYVRRVLGLGDNNVFERVDTYDVYATGVSMFDNLKLGSGQKKVERSVIMRVRLRSFANYLYLTDKEETIFNEIIWFWGEDTLRGRVHSNQGIGIKGRPFFYGPVSTCADDFVHGQGYNPYFEYLPIFNAPPVNFPVTADNVRNNSAVYIDDNSGSWMTRLTVQNVDVSVQQWARGTPFNIETLVNTYSVTLPQYSSIFVDGEVELQGSISGKSTIGASGNIWLIDNIKYVSTNDYNGLGDESTQEMLGIISEKNVIIKNVWANGRENSRQGSDIIINAAIVALDESFTFEQQNDDFDLYQGNTPDERGTIFLWGMVAQKRRGYVHRSNHNGTGYGKSYNYDFRLDKSPPPNFLNATDEQGHGLFDIMSWNHIKPSR